MPLAPNDHDSTGDLPDAGSVAPGPVVPGEARHLRVFRDDRQVLDLVGRPGILVSLSAPPPRPGEPPVTHPFATATFMTAETEGELGRLLRGANTLDAFVAATLRAGYRVEEDPAGRAPA
jgi:hypothetical protein